MQSDAETPIPMPPETAAQIFQISRVRKMLYGNGDRNDPWSVVLATVEKAAMGADAESNQGSWAGEKAHPFDMSATAIFKNANTHHSTCIETKAGATVGLGFKSDKVAKALDPLVGGVNYSFQDVLNRCGEDYWNTGNAYFEIYRDASGKILGIHHVEAKRVYVCVETTPKRAIHYVVTGVDSDDSSGQVRMAKFGDREDFLARNKGRLSITDPLKVSEMIHIPRGTSLSRWYGFPDWLSAVAAIELVQCMHQQQFDFFLNRGVPEFMLFLIGAQLPAKDWEIVTTALRANIGLGNSHKSIALNITDPNVKVQLEKLALEGQTDAKAFSEMQDTLALEIVSAHRVPPLLAGIQIPGKLGANNELPNALMSFQALVVGPAQHSFETTLGATLGNPKTNSGLGLSAADFDLKEITEEVDLGLASTVGGMRQPLAEANAQGRDLKDGLKKAIAAELADVDGVTNEELGKAWGALMSHTLMSMIRRNRAAA